MSNSDKEFEEWGMSEWTIKDDLEMLLLKEVEGGAFVYAPDMYNPDWDNIKANLIRGCPESRIDDLYKKYYQSQLTEKDKKIQTLEALLIEACKEIYWSTRYDEDSGILSIEDCEPERQRYDGHKLFLNKPEIKKLLEGVKGE